MSGLTYQPSRDNEAELRVFLKTVCQRYANQNRTALLSLTSRDDTKSGGEGQAKSLTTKNLLVVDTPGVVSEATKPAYKALYKVAVSTIQEQNLKMQPSERTRPKKRAPSATGSRPTHGSKKPSKVGLSTATRVSLLRAKQIDTQAPDPEQLSPPNETQDERRRRMERINGRRKRTKKLIEIDQLNDQVVDLAERNQQFRHENKDMVHARDALRQALLDGDGDLKEAIAAASALLVPVEDAAIGKEADANVEETKPSASAQGEEETQDANLLSNQLLSHLRHRTPFVAQNQYKTSDPRQDGLRLSRILPVNPEPLQLAAAQQLQMGRADSATLAPTTLHGALPLSKLNRGRTDALLLQNQLMQDSLRALGTTRYQARLHDTGTRVERQDPPSTRELPGARPNNQQGY